MRIAGRALVGASPFLAAVACGSVPDLGHNTFTPNAGVDASVPPVVDDGTDAPIGSCAAGECCIEASNAEKGVRLLVRMASCNVVRGRSVHFDIGIETKVPIAVEGFASITEIPKGGPLSDALQHAARDSASRYTIFEIDGAATDGGAADGGATADLFCYCATRDEEEPAPRDDSPVVAATSHFYPLTWTGRRRNLPSAYAEPDGPVFEAGAASISVSFAAAPDSVVTGKLPFTISE